MEKIRVDAFYGDGKAVRRTFDSLDDARRWVDDNKFVEKKTNCGLVRLPFLEFVIVRVTEEVIGRCHG